MKDHKGRVQMGVQNAQCDDGNFLEDSLPHSLTHLLTKVFCPYLSCLWIDLDILYGFAT